MFAQLTATCLSMEVETGVLISACTLAPAAFNKPLLLLRL
jgi:hypothetical protein